MKKEIHIIGAGFSGLTLAYYLCDYNFDITIFDDRGRVGGLINTEQLSSGPAETAANGILTNEQVEDLFARLGIRPVTMKRESRARFIFRNGKLRRWPIGFLSSIRFVFFLLRYLLCPRQIAPRPMESISTWGERVLNREIVDSLLSPALQGIYAGSTSQLSATLILGRLFKKQSTKIAKGHLRGTIAPIGGMGELTQALQKYLLSKGVRFELNKISTVNNDNITVIASNPHDAAKLIESKDPILAQKMARITMLPITTLTVFWKNAEKIPGFGILFPRNQSTKALGVLANSQIFPNRGKHYNETWIFGGATDLNATTIGKDELYNEVKKIREKIFPGGEPLEFFQHTWPSAIPYYNIDLEKFLNELKDDYFDGKIFFTGNYWGNLGLAKILNQNFNLAKRIFSQHGK